MNQSSFPLTLLNYNPHPDEDTRPDTLTNNIIPSPNKKKKEHLVKLLAATTGHKTESPSIIEDQWRRGQGTPTRQERINLGGEWEKGAVKAWEKRGAAGISASGGRLRLR